MFRVDDLQAAEPSALPPAEGIRVVLDPEKDSMGFDRATVIGSTRKAVLDYVRDNWGDDDDTGGWFTEYVVNRVEPYDPTPLPREQAVAIAEELRRQLVEDPGEDELLRITVQPLGTDGSWEILTGVVETDGTDHTFRVLIGLDGKVIAAVELN